MVQRGFVQRASWTAFICLALVSLVASKAKADDIVFTGNQAGSCTAIGEGCAVIASTATGVSFAITGAPLDGLSINGISSPFAGELDVTGATDGTAGSSNDIVFSGGTLTISSGGTDLVTSDLLASALTTTSTQGVYAYVADLDPNNTTFGGVLASEPALVEGVGITAQILIPIDSVGAVGPVLGSEVILDTPEPSMLSLLAIGLAGFLILSCGGFFFRSRQRRAVQAVHASAGS